MSKKRPKTWKNNPYFWLAGVVIVFAIVFLWFSRLAADRHSSVTTSQTPTPTPTASPTPTTVTSSASPTASPTPTATPSTGLSALPATAQTLVKDFYTAYEAGNSAQLATYFTTDTTSDLQSLRARLFTGLDTNGVPGGPTLFVSSTALERPTSYVVSSVSGSASTWTLTVQETRLNGNGKALPTITTVLKLDEVGNGWKIDQYAHTGSAQKYDGFFTSVS